MDSNKQNWALGEIVTLPRKTSPVNSKYEHLMASRYICIKESEGGECGMLLKVLGKMTREHITMQGGEPFCKDDKNEGFTSDTYYSYRFPSEEEVKEVIRILRGKPNLVEIFENASMHINPNSTYWVRDITGRLPFLKKPQYYDAHSGELLVAGDDKPHYRLTIAYFYKSKLGW